MSKNTLSALKVLTLTLFLFTGFLACKDAGPGLGPSVDINAPTVSIDSHSNDQYIRSTITLSGTVTEDQSVESVIVKFDSTELAAQVTPPADDNSQVYTWSVSLDSNSYTQGVKDILVTATDGYEKTGNQKILLNFDNQAPIVLINTPTVVTNLNGDVSIKGETADNYRITDVRLTLTKSNGDTVLDNVSVTGTQSWYYTLNSRNLGGAVLNGTYKLKVVAEDIAGNVSNTTFYKIALNADSSDAGSCNVDDLYTIYYGGSVEGLSVSRTELNSLKLGSNILSMDIDQDADLPVIHATYPSLTGTAADNAMNSSSLATGQVIDDDGVDTNRIYYMIDGTSADFDDDAKWTLVDEVTSTGSWNFSITGAQDASGNPVGEGAHTLNLRAYDLNGTGRIFTEQSGSQIDFAIDSGSPVFTAGPAPAIGAYFNTDIHVTGSVADGAGLGEVRIYFDGSEVVTILQADIEADDTDGDGNPLTFEFDRVIDIDEAGHSDDGSKVIKIEVEDVGGRINQKEILINVDTEVPGVSLQSPVNGATVNGEFTVIGSGSDNSRIGTLEYYLSTSILNAAALQNIDDNNLWLADFNAGSDGYNWSKTIDSLAYHTGAGDLYLYVHATDVGGNSSTTSFNFAVDQSADKPEFDFGNMDPAAVDYTVNALDSASQISGTISDDDGIVASSVQFRITDASDTLIDADDDGVTTDWMAVSTPPASNGLLETWRQKLKDLNGVDEGYYKIQFRAYDSEVSDYSNSNKMVETPLILFSIDSNPPSITLDGSSPANGDYISTDTLDVSGVATDTLGVAQIRIEIGGDTPLTGAIYLIPEDLDDDGTLDAGEDTNGDGVLNDFDNVILEDTYWSTSIDLVGNGITSGTISLKFSAVDISGKTGTSEIQYTIDKEKPVIGDLVPADNTMVNGTFILSGTTSDNDRVSELELFSANNDPGHLAPLASFSNTDFGGTISSWNIDLEESTYGNFTYGLRPDSVGLTVTTVSNLTELYALTPSDGDFGKIGTVYYLYNAAMDQWLSESDPWVVDFDLVATDRAENISDTSTMRVIIDPASDLPEITLDNYTTAGINNKEIFQGTQVEGTVRDDDGIDISTLEINFNDGNGWVSVDNITGSDGDKVVTFTHTIPAGLAEGLQNVQVHVSDNTPSAVTMTLEPKPFYVDNGAPVLTFSGATNGSYRNADFDLTGTATEGNEIASITVSYGVVSDDAVTDLSGDLSDWEYPVDTSSVAVGTSDVFDITITAEDEFGNIGIKELTVNIDKDAPDYGDMSPVDGSSVNGTFTISGTTSDDDKVVSVELYATKPATDELVGSIVGTVLTGMTGSVSSWKATVDITDYDEITYGDRPPMDYTVGTLALLKAETPTEGEYGEVNAEPANDGIYYYNGAMWVPADPWIVPFQLEVEDRAGNSMTPYTFELLLDQGTDTPVVNLSNLDPDAAAPAVYTDANMLQSVLALMGSVIDDDGVSAGNIQISYNYDGTNEETTAIWTAVNGSDAGTSYSMNYDLSGSGQMSNGDEGDGTISIRVLDEDYVDASTPYNKIIIGPINFAIDTAAPVIALDGSNEIADGDYLKAGDVLDIVFSVTEPNFDDTAPTVEGNAVTGSGPYTYEVVADTEGSGTKAFVISATDDYGKNTTFTLNFTVDVDAPVITINNLADNQELNGPDFMVQGSIEEDYGFAATSPVQVNIDGAGAVDAAGTYSWSYTFLMDSLLPGDEGELADLGTYPLVVTAVDKAGNVGTATLNFTINQEADRPSAEINNLGGEGSDYQQPQVSISHADNEDVLVGVLYSEDGSTITPGNVSVMWDLDGDNVPDALPDAPVFLTTGDVVAFYVKMIDDVTYPEATRDLSITYSGDDITDPASNVQGFYDIVGNNVVVLNDSSHIIGLAIDDDALTSKILDINGVEELNVTDSTASYNLKFSVASLSEGIHLAQFKVADVNGVPNSSSTLFIKDVSAPVLTITAPSQGDYINDSVSTQGTVTDGFAIRSLYITADDVGGSQILDFGVMGLGGSEFVQTDSQNWSWDFTLEALDDSYSSEVITLKYEAQDIAGHITEKDRTVTVDNINPSVVITEPGISDVVNGFVTIRGTASDYAVDSVQVELLQSSPLQIDLDGIDGNCSLADYIDPDYATAPQPGAPSGTYNWSVDVYSNNYASLLYSKPNGFTLEGIYETEAAALAREVSTAITGLGSTITRSEALQIGDIVYVRDNGSGDPATLEFNGTDFDSYLGQWDSSISVTAIDRAGNSTTTTTTLQIDENTDRPNVTVLSPADTGDRITLGGTVTLFGNANDDDGISVVQVRVDLNNDGDFNDAFDLSNPPDGDTADFLEDETQWYDADGTYSWSLDINDNGELYAVNDGDATDDGNITVQVRTLDINGVESTYRTRDIKLDDTVPQFGADMSHQSGDYENGSFTITGTITDDTDLDEIEISYDGGSSWDTLADLSSGNSDVTYNLNLFVDTLDPGSEASILTSGVLPMIIRAWDASSPNRLKTNYYIDINVDNQNPAGNLESDPGIFDKDDILGTTARIYGNAADSGTINGLNRVVVYLTNASGDVYNIRDANVDAVLPAASYTDYTDLLDTGNAWASLDTLGQNALESDYAFVIDDMNEYGDDANNGNDIDGIENGDEDDFHEYITSAAGGTDWWVEFDSTFVKDGAVTINVVVEDNAGNISEFSENGVIANNKPQFSNVKIGDDLDSTGGVSDGEIFNYTYDPDLVDAELPQMIEDLRIQFEISAAGATAFDISVHQGTTSAAALGGMSVSALADGGTYNQTLDISGYTAGVYNFYVKAVETTSGVLSYQHIKVNKTDSDGVPPEVQVFALDENYTDYGKQYDDTFAGDTAVINTLNNSYQTRMVLTDIEDDSYFRDPNNSSNDTGVYQGHLELVSDSGDGDADVSGIVTLSGYAYDNRAIKGIVADIDSFSAGAAHDLPGDEGTDETKVLAYWDPALGLVANDLGTFATTGEEFTISSYDANSHFKHSDQNLGKDGHLVYWTYKFDTSKITGVAASDINIKVRAIDFYSLDNDVTGSHDDTLEDGHIQIDVVPYISSLERDSDYTTIRARSGAYPLNRTAASGTITLNGYNLGSTTETPVITVDGSRTDHGGTEGTHYTDMTGETVSADGKTATFTVPADTMTGWLKVFVNSVEAINNTNNNTALYNSENLMSSDSSDDDWNDDRYIHIWQSDDTTNSATNNGYFEGSSNPVHPAMSINNNGMLYGTWSSYSDSSTYFNENDTTGATAVFDKYDPPEHVDIDVSGADDLAIVINANYMGGSWGTNWTSSGGVALWESLDEANMNWTGDFRRRDHRLEPLDNDDMLMQFINQRIKVNGNDAHITYYDVDTSSLKYNFVNWSGTGDDESYADRSWVNIAGGYDGDDINVVGGTASRDSGNPSAGQFSAIDVQDNNNPVIAYYDIANQTLKIAIANTNNPGAGNWTIVDAMDGTDDNYNFSGKYVSMIIEQVGGAADILHMAFYRTSTGELVYLQSTLNGTTYSAGTSQVVDSVGSVGNWSDITLNGSTPVISYLDGTRANSFNGLKMAYLDGSEWEYMNVPLDFAIDDNRTCIETDTGSNVWDYAIGYASDFYRLTYYIPQATVYTP